MIPRKQKKERAIPREEVKAGKIKKIKDRAVKTVAAAANKEKRGEDLRLSELHKLCHREWSKIVKCNACHVCEWCGRPAIHAHHMIAKAQGNKLKYDLRNGVALCYACHVEFHQKNSAKGWKLMQRQRPEDFEFIWNEPSEEVKWTRGDMRQILADLRETLRGKEAA